MEIKTATAESTADITAQNGPAEPGHPQEQLEVEEPYIANDEMDYPTGSRFVAVLIALGLVVALTGLVGSGSAVTDS